MRVPVDGTLRFKSAVSTFDDCRCQLSAEPAKKPCPWMALPPSLGTRFRYTPPAELSADTPLVLYTASAMSALSM